MGQDIQVEVCSSSGLVQERHKKAIEDLRRRFGSGVEVTVDKESDGYLHDFTTVTVGVVGTVAVANPQLLEEVIRYVYHQDELTVADIVGGDIGPFIEVNEVNVDLTLCEINRRIELDDSQVLVEPSSEEEAEKLRERND